MADKVAKLSIQRDNDFMYYIKKGDVWRSPRKKAGAGSAKGKAEKVASAGVTLDYAKYIYYLDGDGDIAREARQVGGSKRKAAKKAAPKKAAKKPAKKAAPKKAAKKPAKKAPAKKPAKKGKKK
jgi:hypothetical protein